VALIYINKHANEGKNMTYSIINIQNNFHTIYAKYLN